MPLYEYRCNECESNVEVIQKFSDPDLAECSECGGSLERLVSAPAIRFKGSGWYVNDYARKGPGGAGSKKSEKTEKPAEKSSKTESKSSTKVA
jgi:putative FmdB family regulatory protein